MKTCLLFFVLCISQTLYAQSSWKPLGGNGGLVSDANSLQSIHPAIAVDTSGTPYIIYSDLSDSSRIRVKKFNGSNWINVGTNGTHHRGVLGSIAISSKDSIYIAFYDDSNISIDSSKFTIIKFDGTDWVPVGNSIFEAGFFVETSLRVDSNEKLYLGYAFGSTTKPGKSNIKTFDGTDWVPVGNTDFVQYSSRMSLRIGLNNELYVGYDTYYLTGITSTNSWVQKWNGSGWDTVGTSLYPIYNIDIASDGTLYAMDDQANHGVSVKKLVNNGWVLQGNTYQYYPGGVLVIDKNNVPHIVVGSGVIKYDGTNWGGYGDTLVTQTNYILNSRLAFGKDNIPYVTGTNGSSQNEKIFAFYYDSVLTDVKVLKSELSLDIYPNPTHNNTAVFIKATSLPKGEYTATLYNSYGQIVYETTYVHSGGNFSQALKIENNIPSGIYYLSLSNKRFYGKATLIIH